MGKYLGIILVWLLASCATFQAYHTVPAKVTSWAESNVYRVSTAVAWGTGFYINSTQMITACHVVGESTIARIGRPGKKSFKRMSVKFCDKDGDVALLENTSSLTPGAQNTTLSYAMPPIGTAVWGAGHPLGGPLTITLGNLGNKLTPSAYIITTPTVPGDSGSPVLAIVDGKITVVGIRVSIARDSMEDNEGLTHPLLFTHLTFMVGSPTILDLMDENL